MRVLLAASEVAGFAKTGGLADVAGSLPRALAARGRHEPAVAAHTMAFRKGYENLWSVAAELNSGPR